MRGNPMADNKKSGGAGKAMTKAAVVQEVSTKTQLSKKQVVAVFDALTDLIKAQLGKKGPGVFTLPGLAKMKKVHKPATKAREGIHPITKQKTTFKAKPARNTVRARALKNLNDLIK